MNGRVLVLPAHRMEAQCVRRTLERSGIATAATDDAQVDAVVSLGFPEPQVPAADGQEATVDPRLLVLVSEVDEASLRRAAACGAAGLMVSSAPTASLVEAVEALRRGELELPELESIDEDDEFSQLTDREREIVHLLAGGAQNREIAEALGISYHTVRTHVHHVMAKLDVTHRHAVAAWVHRSATSRRASAPGRGS